MAINYSACMTLLKNSTSFVLNDNYAPVPSRVYSRFLMFKHVMPSQVEIDEKKWIQVN